MVLKPSADAISSTLAQTNAQGGGLANSYGYSPYGESNTVGPDATNNPSQYTGRENDGATGLLFYRARYYDPVLKRFISEDPIGLAGGMNVYAYVNGNPVSLNDPSGLVYRGPGNSFGNIPPPGPGCQKADWGPGGYIYGWKPCDQPPDSPPMQCPAQPKPWNPPENPLPKPPEPPPGPTPEPSPTPKPPEPPHPCDDPLTEPEIDYVACGICAAGVRSKVGKKAAKKDCLLCALSFGSPYLCHVIGGLPDEVWE